MKHNNLQEKYMNARIHLFWLQQAKGHSKPEQDNFRVTSYIQPRS